MAEKPFEHPHIEPCPFGCKDPPTMHEIHARYRADHDGPAGSYAAAYSINCHTCGIEMIDEYEADLLERWNTRIGDAPKNEEDVDG